MMSLSNYVWQIITTLEEDSTAQKMQLGYRLQQIAAAVENKVTDLWLKRSQQEKKEDKQHIVAQFWRWSFSIKWTV